jgi:uncharacterized membrane-anchored protein YitT (DUF2179 family)
MLFALGATLFALGLSLFTYNAQIVANGPLSVFGYHDIPHAEQFQPYLTFGIVTSMAAIPLIGIALYKMSLKSQIRKIEEELNS